jgi:hypothetical protein
LLDYCQCWIDLYRAFLPVGKRDGFSQIELEAMQHTSQAAVASVQLFQAWFQSSVQSEDGFDCFFRPYLYHFMSTKGVFSVSRGMVCFLKKKKRNFMLSKVKLTLFFLFSDRPMYHSQVEHHHLSILVEPI